MTRKKMILNLLVGALLAFTFASAQHIVYTFENGTLTGPETLSLNGYQNILFINKSDTELDMSLLRLHEGVTLEEVIAADNAIEEAFSTGGDAGKAIGEFLSLADAIGGLSVEPMSQGSAYLLLEPGFYGVGASSGGGPEETSIKAHMKLRVGEGEVAEAPTAAFNLTMGDFHLDFPDTMPAGEQLWQISSTGQPHMALIFKLTEGATADDVMSFIMSEGEPSGPPPFEFGTAISALSSGQSFYTSLSLSPGNYVAICPLPDLAGQGNHAEHGMVDSFTVK